MAVSSIISILIFQKFPTRHSFQAFCHSEIKDQIPLTICTSVLSFFKSKFSACLTETSWVKRLNKSVASRASFKVRGTTAIRFSLLARRLKADIFNSKTDNSTAPDKVNFNRGVSQICSQIFLILRLARLYISKEVCNFVASLNSPPQVNLKRPGAILRSQDCIRARNSLRSSSDRAFTYGTRVRSKRPSKLVLLQFLTQSSNVLREAS
ncbi:hypothetical protein FF38_10076 [Lucilia cuprina]|uniref:Uncharacterized protein n=1 Tax=Lucilia cuprina TaxID=7375 RepID=A0A0L0CHN9_LUCCU|nr:hypothetical protein FF38_10076 [Lucilia cuprina]